MVLVPAWLAAAVSPDRAATRPPPHVGIYDRGPVSCWQPWGDGARGRHGCTPPPASLPTLCAAMATMMSSVERMLCCAPSAMPSRMLWMHSAAASSTAVANDSRRPPPSSMATPEWHSSLGPAPPPDAPGPTWVKGAQSAEGLRASDGVACGGGSGTRGAVSRSRDACMPQHNRDRG